MELIQRLFSRPSQITTFWAYHEIKEMQTQVRDAQAHLWKFCPDWVLESQPKTASDWFFQVNEFEGGPFAGDYLPHFLPSRRNIIVLNQACITASVHLGALLERGIPKYESGNGEDLFKTTEAYSGASRMDISNANYQKELWEVFDQDWGLSLPSPGEFGRAPVRLSYRPGLPCAAAMIHAVIPLMELKYGKLTRVKQESERTSSRVMDICHLETEKGIRVRQEFDITELYGRENLDWNNFEFGSQT